MELADVCGLNGEARRLATGRANRPRFALKPALGLIGSPLPRASPVTCAWRVVAAWLLHLQRALLVVQDRVQRPKLTALCVVGRVLKRFRLHGWQNMDTDHGAALFHTWHEGIQRDILYRTQSVVVLRMEATPLRVRAGLPKATLLRAGAAGSVSCTRAHPPASVASTACHASQVG